MYITELKAHLKKCAFSFDQNYYKYCVICIDILRNMTYNKEKQKAKTKRKRGKQTMKAANGYSKEDYKKAPVVLEFETMEKAAEYLEKKYNQDKESIIRAIEDDTNEDAVYFEDGTVILNELA